MALPCVPDDTTVLAPTCPELLDALADERARISRSIEKLAAARAILDRLISPTTPSAASPAALG
jgi:hypothetical protein